ncbi:unnamed protein product [Adineta steineri]|uniref:Uncharacterized protein n=1 Tax=Adineta steineri TaxID=433720 RepID=A0A814B9H7_9BILA|nr:unnamed protein product [Adineta steineri]CAF1141298.1 unnamed protein product [Adineta steineri]
MRASSAANSVRILPTNKVYRQLFDAQVQLSDAYNRVRDNQLSEPINIVTHPDATPLVRNIRPHESQKRQWISSLPYNNDSSINPVAIFFQDEQKRRQTEEEQELETIKQEVFNLPDNMNGHGQTENDVNSKVNVTGRLEAKRQIKFKQLWDEFLEKIAELNQNLLKELEGITRECNMYYEQGNKDIDKELQTMIYQKEITTLSFQLFDDEFQYLEKLLPSRHSKIQEYCQSIEELEMERTNKFRDLFKHYSDRLYRTHHLSDEDTASQLEKQANKLNSQIIENRKIYTELEARLLSGETDRIHHYREELVDYQNKWRENMWIILKQTWIARLSKCKVRLDAAIQTTCEPIGSNIAEKTRRLIEHINKLNTFIPPKSTKENAQKWHKQGYDIMDGIINERKILINQIIQIIKNEINYLEEEWKIIGDKVIQTQVYNNEQIEMVYERDIEPLLEERKQFLQESVIDQAKIVYEQLTNSMYNILDQLLAFIQPASCQWDNHQSQLERVTEQLADLMSESRRPHDLQNEKKLTKLDSTLDEMRSASNESILNRLLKSAYDQLDTIQANFTQFYKMEHEIVNKYSDMVTEEVNRYKNEMLDYFHAKEINTNDDESLSLPDTNPQLYTTSIARTTYKIEEINNNNESHLTENINAHNEEHGNNISNDQPQVQTFLTEDSSLTDIIPCTKSFQMPSNLVQSIMFNLCRAFLDYYDQWKEETIRRADAVIFTKHDELDKEMDFQMHLHEPRRIRIENDVHHVRAVHNAFGDDELSDIGGVGTGSVDEIDPVPAPLTKTKNELSTHDERIERHIRGVDETLEQTDTNYRLMLNDFSKSINTYKDDIHTLEQLFVNATTTTRLVALQERLAKKRDTFMENVRISLRNFRQQFDEAMQCLRHANASFRESFIIFSEGGNYSREEIEVYRRKLEKTAGQIDKAETAILKEMEKLEKKQLEEATKIISLFQERFKNHMTDLQFIELANRWISDTQVKIKAEVGANNQQAQTLKKLIQSYQNQIDSFLNPNIDKQKTTLNEIRDIFQQILLMNYERALYLKCLNNELIIPASIVSILKNKGLITEEKLANDLHSGTNTDEMNTSRRPSKINIAARNSVDEVKSVKFAAPTRTTLSRNKSVTNTGTGLTNGHPEEMNTISTIRTLLHKSEHQESDEIVEADMSNTLASNSRSLASRSSSRSSQVKFSNAKFKNKKRPSVDGSVASSTTRRNPQGRAKTRDEIYALYCIFGEKKHSDQDFISRILNVLRESNEGLLTHAELYYREKGSRPVTRPQALREKFDDYANTMIEKLKSYEEQCRSYYEHSINEFRDMLELFERTSSLLAKAELNERTQQAEKVLNELKQQFDTILNGKFDDSTTEKSKNYDQLRPTLGHPARKNDLLEIDNREKIRQNELQQLVTELRLTTIKSIKTDAQTTVQALATNAEHLLILFDDILTADEIIKTKIPEVKQPLSELVRRQQSGRPLENRDPKPILERKQGHWPGLPLLDEQILRPAITTKKRSTAASQRQKTSASVVTQKTTLPQMETVAQRNQAYQHYKKVYIQTLSDIENRCSTILTDLDRYRSHWKESIEKLQQLRTC